MYILKHLTNGTLSQTNSTNNLQWGLAGYVPNSYPAPLQQLFNVMHIDSTFNISYIFKCVTLFCVLFKFL